MPTEIMRGNFVVLRAGPLHLILPQGEVGAAEHIEGGLHPSGRPGVFSHGEGPLACEVVAPSERLEILETLSSRLCGVKHAICIYEPSRSNHFRRSFIDL